MKYKVIKEYSGIGVDSEVNLSESSAKYMIEQGYVEPIQIEENKNITFEISGEKLTSVLGKAQNKAIEPKYKRNKLK